MHSAGKLNVAFELYSEANRLKPRDIHILYKIALNLYDIELSKPVSEPHHNRLREALYYLSEIIDVNGTISDVYVLRGKVYLLLNEPAKAIEDFNHALSIDSSHPEANIQKALLLLGNKDCKQSKLYFIKGTTAVNDNPHLFFFRPRKAADEYERQYHIVCERSRWLPW